jgi:hypothetical protein
LLSESPRTGFKGERSTSPVKSSISHTQLVNTYEVHVIESLEETKKLSKFKSFIEFREDPRLSRCHCSQHLLQAIRVHRLQYLLQVQARVRWIEQVQVLAVLQKTKSESASPQQGQGQRQAKEWEQG